jgi:ketosteroid isomerase-like protein
MEQARISQLSERFLAAWNSQDPDSVVALYTADLVYRDPNTRGEIHGADSFRRYLSKLFARWTMQWSLREAHPLEGREGLAVLWRAALAPAGGGDPVQVEGMDLIELEGDRVKRNEVYFDRVALSRALSVWQRIRLLLR